LGTYTQSQRTASTRARGACRRSQRHPHVSRADTGTGKHATAHSRGGVASRLASSARAVRREEVTNEQRSSGWCGRLWTSREPSGEHPPCFVQMPPRSSRRHPVSRKNTPEPAKNTLFLAKSTPVLPWVREHTPQNARRLGVHSRGVADPTLPRRRDEWTPAGYHAGRTEHAASRDPVGAMRAQQLAFRWFRWTARARGSRQACLASAGSTTIQGPPDPCSIPSDR
jgi:hypothetical protein